jgi:protein TilB
VLDESADGRSLQLDVAFDRLLDTSAIQADVQPGCVRLLAKGRLLQLALPLEVRPDASVAQRSKTTGHLLVTMPLADERVAPLRAVAPGKPGGSAGSETAAAAGCQQGPRGAKAAGGVDELPAAVVSPVRTGDVADEDELPPL